MTFLNNDFMTCRFDSKKGFTFLKYDLHFFNTHYYGRAFLYILNFSKYQPSWPPSQPYLYLKYLRTLPPPLFLRIIAIIASNTNLIFSKIPVNMAWSFGAVIVFGSWGYREKMNFLFPFFYLLDDSKDRSTNFDFFLIALNHLKIKKNY